MTRVNRPKVDALRPSSKVFSAQIIVIVIGTERNEKRERKKKERERERYVRGEKEKGELSEKVGRLKTSGR